MSTDATLIASRQIITAYLGANQVPPSAVPDVITSVYRTIEALERGEEHADPQLLPVVSIKKSITPSTLTCLVCGLPFKSIKRHLGSQHNMTPEQYRAAFALPADYPMVAPEYSATRSALAKNARFWEVPK
jgi:predicted transcriptional regulator